MILLLVCAVGFFSGAGLVAWAWWATTLPDPPEFREGSWQESPAVRVFVAPYDWELIEAWDALDDALWDDE